MFQLADVAWGKKYNFYIFFVSYISCEGSGLIKYFRVGYIYIQPHV